MGLSLERIMTDMQNLPLRDEVWPKFLRGNAAKLLRIGASS
jgi:predicted TIM-barrel fold metal-dependent hydrolase